MSFYLMSFGKPRFLGVVEIDKKLQKGNYLVVESARGLELALILGETNHEKIEQYKKKFCDSSQEESPQLKGGEPSFQELVYIREAEGSDLSESSLQREEEEKVLLEAREILKDHKLPMKLVEAEYLLDRKKLFFFFTSEQRIDFRAFVKDLARKFKTRIELRQIGVRDEAKVVKGLGPCGRPCCCGYWLNSFEPICIRMVKEQNLSLNPAKTSGICGRLMCCIAYERETYSKLWGKLPNPGSKIKGPDATYVISGVDIISDSVRIIEPGKGEILVHVDKFEAFRECVEKGEPWSDFQIKPLILEDVDETLDTGDMDGMFEGNAEMTEIEAKTDKFLTYACDDKVDNGICHKDEGSGKESLNEKNNNLKSDTNEDLQFKDKQKLKRKKSKKKKNKQEAPKRTAEKSKGARKELKGKEKKVAKPHAKGRNNKSQ